MTDKLFEPKEMYYKDPKTGETYVAPLSMEKMDKIYQAVEENNKQIERSNKLKIGLIVVIVGFVLYMASRVETLTHLLQRVFC